MKKKEMIFKIQKRELELRYSMFAAEDALDACDPILTSRIRVWGAHTSLMDDLCIELICSRLRKPQDIQQVIDSITLTNRF